MTQSVGKAFISLLFYILCSFYGCDAPSDLSFSCLPLSDVKLKNICTGAYPREAKQRYADQYVKPGLSYTVFAFNDHEGYYMIAHGYSDLTTCDEITVTSPRHIDCNGQDVYLKSSILRCLPFHTQIADDLISHCSKGKEQPKTAFTAMFYVRATIYGDEKIMEGGSRIMYTGLFIFASFIVTQLM